MVQSRRVKIKIIYHHRASNEREKSRLIAKRIRRLTMIIFYVISEKTSLRCLIVTIIIIKSTSRVKALSLLPDMRVCVCVCARRYARLARQIREIYSDIFCAREKSRRSRLCEKILAVEKRREGVTTCCLQMSVYIYASSELKHVSKHV